MRGIINDDVESFRGGLFAHVRKEFDVLLVALEQRDAISQIPVRWDLQIGTDNAGTGNNPARAGAIPLCILRARAV